MASPALVTRNGEWENLQLSLQWIYEGKVNQMGTRGSFHPDNMAAWLVQKGTVTVWHEGRRFQGRAGEWFIPWSGFRNQEFSPGAEILSIRFEAHWPDGKPLFDRGLSTHFSAVAYPELEKRARRLLRVASSFGPTGPRGEWLGVALSVDDYLKIHGLLGRFAAGLWAVLCQRGLRPTRLGIRDDRVGQALAWLDSQPLTIRFREDELASQVGLGGKQFVRIFRAEAGITPRHYFERRRRDVVMRLLLGTALPIKEIAADLGFPRSADFSTWFKGQHGVPPREFRRRFFASESV